MKVLHIINSLGMGGAERLLVALLPEMKKQGLEVDLLLLNKGNESVYTTVIEKGVNVSCLNVGYERNPLVTFQLIPYCGRDYDIIHAHLFPTQYWITFANMFAKRKSKLVFTEHSTSNSRISSSIISKIDRYLYTKLDCLLCITKEVEDIYLNYQPKLVGKTAVIPNGVPINELKRSSLIDLSLFNIKQGKRVILQVSAFRVGKQQEVLVEALKYLPDNFVVMFAGDGTRRKEVETVTKSMGFEDRVIFLGNRNDVYSLQKSVDYLVLSTHYEGLSLACVEGMASGKPFLASDVKGVRNLVDGAGILFEERNAKQLADIILELEQNPKLRLNTVRKGEERASQYSIEKCAQKHIELYIRLLDH